MSTKITRAMLLATLILGTTMIMFSPPANAQAAVAYTIAFTDGQVNLDVRPGASGVGCTEMIVGNEGQATIDVDVALSGGGVTISLQPCLTLTCGDKGYVDVLFFTQLKHSSFTLLRKLAIMVSISLVSFSNLFISLRRFAICTFIRSDLSCIINISLRWLSSFSSLGASPLPALSEGSAFVLFPLATS